MYAYKWMLMLLLLLPLLFHVAPFFTYPILAVHSWVLWLYAVCVWVFFLSRHRCFRFWVSGSGFHFFLSILCVYAHNSNSPFFYFMLMRSAFAMALSKMLVSCSILKILWNNIESTIDGYIVEFRFCKITTNPFILSFIRSPPSLSYPPPSFHSLSLTISFQNEPITFKIAWNGAAQFFLIHLHICIKYIWIDRLMRRARSDKPMYDRLFARNCLDFVVRNKLVFNPFRYMYIYNIRNESAIMHG